MKIILATGNLGKVDEFKGMVSGLDITFMTQGELGVRSVEETGFTFVENALIKARHAVSETGMPAIADDSGLVISGLNGAPGIYSSRYAGLNCSSDDCIDKVLLDLEGCEGDKRRAYFYTSIVYMTDEKEATPCMVSGVWHGEILKRRQGSHGMGYDPIFYVPTHQCSAAELDVSLKNRLSHRGQAMAQLRERMGWKVSSNLLSQ